MPTCKILSVPDKQNQLHLFSIDDVNRETECLVADWNRQTDGGWSYGDRRIDVNDDPHL